MLPTDRPCYNQDQTHVNNQDVSTPKQTNDK